VTVTADTRQDQDTLVEPAAVPGDHLVDEGAGHHTEEEAPRRRPGVVRATVLPWFALIMTVLAMFAVLLVGYLFVFTHTAATREQHVLASQFNERVAILAALGHRVPDGTPIATLEIPAIGVHQIAVYGTSAADLEKGPGLMPRTAPPGVRGNSVIAGRRVTFGRPFANLLSLVKGDRIIVINGRGTFTYRVTRSGVARPGQADPVEPSTRPELTLVTSPPLSESGREYVVAALAGPPLAQPRYVITRPTSELALSGDASAVPGTIVWGVLALLAVVATVLAYRRWPQTGTIYFLSTPIMLATAVLWFEHLAQLLPATF
jgi:sortase A